MNKIDIAVVTGITGGLGAAVASNFLAQGIEVVGIGRQLSSPENFCGTYLSADLYHYEDVGYTVRCYAKSIPADKKIAVVLCAATLGSSGGLIDSSLYEWSKVYRTNVLGNLAVVKSLLPNMLQASFGRIVFISGGGAAYGYPMFSAYALSKTAIVREAENLSMELKGKGDFSCIALAPGAMETKMLEQVRAAGAEVRSCVEVDEPVQFIDRFVKGDDRLNGRFLHVRDNLEQYEDKQWLLRRLE